MRKIINLNIEAAALTWLREESAKSGRSMSDLVNEAVYNLSHHDERLLLSIREIIREEMGNHNGVSSAGITNAFR